MLFRLQQGTLRQVDNFLTILGVVISQGACRAQPERVLLIEEQFSLLVLSGSGQKGARKDKGVATPCDALLFLLAQKQ